MFRFDNPQYNKKVNEWIVCRNKIDKKYNELVVIIKTPVSEKQKPKPAVLQKEIKHLITLSNEIRVLLKELRQHNTNLNEFITLESPFMSANLALYEFICLDMIYQLTVCLGMKYFGIVTDIKSSNTEVTNNHKRSVETLNLASDILNVHPTIQEKHSKDFADVLKIVKSFEGYNKIGGEHEKTLSLILQAQYQTSPQQAYNKFQEALAIAKLQENFYQQVRASIGMCNALLKTYISPHYKDFQNNMEVEEAITEIEKIAKPLLYIIELKLNGKVDLITHSILETVQESLKTMANDLCYISTNSLRIVQKEILHDKKMELLVKAASYNTEAEKFAKYINITEPKLPALSETIRNEMKNVEDEKEKLAEEKKQIEEEKKEVEENKKRYYENLTEEIALIDKFIQERPDLFPRKNQRKEKSEIKVVVSSPMHTSSDSTEESESDKETIHPEMPDSEETLEKKLACAINFEEKFYLNCYLGDHHLEEALKTYRNDDEYAVSLNKSMEYYLESLNSFKSIDEKTNKLIDEEKYVVKLQYKTKSLLDKTIKLTTELNKTQNDGREKAKKRKGEDWYKNTGTLSPAAQARLDTEERLLRMIDIQEKIEEKMLALNLKVKKPEKAGLKDKYDEKTNLFGTTGNDRMLGFAVTQPNLQCGKKYF